MWTNRFYKHVICITFLLFSSLAESKKSEKRVQLDGLAINYQFMDDASANLETELNALITRAFAIYTELFNGLPRDKQGKEYSEFTLHVKQGTNMGGEADPGIIMLTWNNKQLFGLASWQTLLLHELFHLWSAESFRYEDGREHWFNEGFAEYYAYKTAVQLGLISERDMLSFAAIPIGHYFSSLGLRNISMRNAGKHNKTKFENYFLVYHGGWVVAMVLDHDIRKRTNDKANLDDLMRWMYTNFPREKSLYNIGDIIAGLNQLTKFDYHDFFELYVDGTEPLPLTKHLPISDALWAFEFKKRERAKFNRLYRTLGFEVVH